MRKGLWVIGALVAGVGATAVGVDHVGATAGAVPRTSSWTADQHEAGPADLVAVSSMKPSSGSQGQTEEVANCERGLALPTRLPPLVMSHAEACIDNPVSGPTMRSTGIGPGLRVAYRLSGDSNADTTPSNGDFSKLSQAQAKSGAVHGATGIDLIVVRSASHLAAAMTDPTNLVSTVRLANGLTARLTVPTDGLGAMRVEWVRGGDAYTLLSAHGRTSSGPSGPTIDDLLAMAGSA